MKATDLRMNLNSKTTEELKHELLSLLQEQFNLRMQKGLQQEAAPKGHSFRNVRRNIARVKTFLNTKERAK